MILAESFWHICRGAGAWHTSCNSPLLLFSLIAVHLHLLARQGDNGTRSLASLCSLTLTARQSLYCIATTSSQTILHICTVCVLLCMPTSPFRPLLMSSEVRSQHCKLPLKEQGGKLLQGKSMKQYWHLSSRCVSVVSKVCKGNYRYPAKNKKNIMMLKCAVFECVTVNFEIPPCNCHHTHTTCTSIT